MSNQQQQQGSKIIDPRTGQPMNSLSDQQIMQAFNAMQQRFEYLNQQNIQLGLLVEYVIQTLEAHIDEDGNQLIDLDLDNFPTFAQNRLQELRKEFQEQQQQQQQQQQADSLSPEDIIAQAQKGRPQVNLDD